MNTDYHDGELASLLDTLREAESRNGASAQTEAAVMHAWDLEHAQSSGVHRSRIGARVLAIAAAAVLASGLTVLGGRLRIESQIATAPIAQSPATLVLVGAPLLEDEPVRLVRMRMPASALNTLGVRTTAAPLDSIDVDLIIGEDGVARAVRMIHQP